MGVNLTIGMATYDDFDGVWFTVQSLKMHHPITKDAEIIVIDNNPEGPHGKNLDIYSKMARFRYETFTEKKSTSTRNELFKKANGKYVICLDSHVLLMPGAIESLLKHWEKDPESNDILSGPLISDNLEGINTSFKPQWRGSMYGIWNYDEEFSKGEPFEIPMMGLGAFACRKDAWPGFNEHFTGFGAEEGYIHEKFRIRGGKALCIPGFQWVHRFLRASGITYPMRVEDRVWNYIIGWMELYKNPEHEVIRGTLEHFKDKFEVEKMQEMIEKAKKIYDIP